MFEYKFVKIEFKILSGKPKEDYREVIQSHAEKGWRFIQVFSPDFVTSGVAAGTYYELIFEKPLEKMKK
ncbi:MULTISPECIES: DUF4177 domain-containing protein [Bacillaceae]|uniref:DUF4177 domain-containing protein n=1 Tax=Bacillaceae TaxID=186817 RepID=UPI000BA618E7|nr:MULTISPECIES: DUF4177 domain-containing protein [Bacillaceae]PAE24881.1 hypothetical protein CHI10_10260 [Bacillus sp. 7894-2]URM32536.1 DUF4177 domain-containing protein [Cytobacillus firmus]